MAIYFDKTQKKWKVDIWLNGRKIKTRSFEKKAFAERFERDSLADIDRMKLTGVQYEELTYNELFQRWFDSKSYRKRKTSLVKDEQMHRDFVSPVIGHLKVNQIREEHFDRIVKDGLKNNLTKSSMNKVIQHFKAVLNYAFEKEIIPRNPSKNFEQIKVESQEMDYLVQDELDEFLTFTDAKYTGEQRIIHVFYMTLFLTGVRLGEALGLNWKDIDFKRDEILVDSQWSQFEKDFVNTTKGKKFRMVPLNALLKSELLALRNNAKGDLVFTYDGVKPFDPSNIRNRHWNKDFKLSKVRRIRMHDARHTYGAIFMMSGGDLYELSKLLGHASITTTEKYAHLSQKHLSGAKEKVSVTIGNRAGVINLSRSPRIHPEVKADSSKDAVND